MGGGPFVFAFYRIHRLWLLFYVLQGRLVFFDVVQRLFLLLLLDVFVWLILREMLLLRGSLKVIDSLKSSQVRISLLISLLLFRDDGDGGGHDVVWRSF